MNTTEAAPIQPVIINDQQPIVPIKKARTKRTVKKEEPSKLYVDSLIAFKKNAKAKARRNYEKNMCKNITCECGVKLRCKYSLKKHLATAIHTENMKAKTYEATIATQPAPADPLPVQV